MKKFTVFWFVKLYNESWGFGLSENNISRFARNK